LKAAVFAIFCLTYLLIAGRRLRILPIGRPAGALLGAVLMVAVGALTPEQSYAAIDHNTIVLLFGMMLLTGYLSRAGFFEWAAVRVLSACRTPCQLLLTLSAFAAVLSAFLVNDTVCIFLTPVVVATCLKAGLPMGPYLIALATSANIGSAATLVGNPQNMIIGSLSRFPFGEFMVRSGAAVIAGLLINAALLWLYYRKKLPERFAEAPGPNPPVDRARLTLAGVVTVGVVTGFFAGLHLGYTTLAGVMVLVVAEREDSSDLFARVDWRLLVLFSSLFIVVEGLARTGIVEEAWAAARPQLSFDRPRGLFLFTGLMVLGSNVVSNVPMVLLSGPHLGELGSPQLGWVLLAFTTTVAGNLTILGSVANIIVAEGARKHYQLGFLDYLRFGLVSTVLVLAAGVPVVVWMS